ncbi:alpha-L-fucosidase [Formosa sp. PL04]|uniref:alpha-L-fucosidase n=1 Tax=Formosa sp. PL04 TaxID=3081755 RepID=UPI00298132CA|nr:alpha-L-fucosidase [Formosa sp. PL04]MDW5289708.1 alpha-L-fucosidase [Formosa sp. PL04]
MKKSIISGISSLLMILTVCGASEVSAQALPNSQQRVIHPNWAPKTWQLRSNDITTIMGYRAELDGNLTHAERSTPKLVKDAAVYGFINDNDIMTWEVESPSEGQYAIALLYCGSSEVLSECTVEITSGTTTIKEETHPPTWDWKPFFQRHHLKKNLVLKAGINKITLRLVDVPELQISAAKKALKGEKRNPNFDNSFGLWSIELVRTEALPEIEARVKSTKADISWMKEGKYGLFVHFSSLGYAFNGNTRLGSQYHEMVDAFDVDAFVKAVVETGASWVIFTCGHGDQHWPGPNNTIDQLKPGFTCERDLIRELIDGLKKHDIRFMLYYNPNSGMDDLYGNVYGDGDTPDPSGYFKFLESLFREVSLRYGEDLASTAGYVDDSGFFLYQYDAPWEALSKAVKAGNPNAPVGWSQNILPRLSPFCDFTVTDGNYSETTIYPDSFFEKNGQYEGLNPVIWIYMDGWINNRPYNGTFKKDPHYSAEEYIEIFKKFDKANIPITINLTSTSDITAEHPFFNPVCMDIMKQVRKAIKGY